MIVNFKGRSENLAINFTLKNIMTPEKELVTCSNEEESKQLLEKNKQYDVIPIKNIEIIYAYVERDKTGLRKI